MAAQHTRHTGWAERLVAVIALVAATATGGAASAQTSVLLATTTSVRDSGLLDDLLPPFSEQTGIVVRTVAVGTGAALRMGSEGNADILLTHAPEAEKQLLASGALSERREIMDNYFILAGPAQDPANVAGAEDAKQAFHRIRTNESPFVSRADDSGTHKKEKKLFEAAGLEPTVRWPGMVRTGSGMGASILVADQRRAYILSDIGTFLAFRDRVDLVELTGPSPALRNVYSVLLVNPERFPGVRGNAARRLADYLQSPAARARIKRFGTNRFDRPLFSPIPIETSAPGP